MPRPGSLRFRWLLLVPLALLYWLSLPRTVQGLDTGEVVAAGARLWVAHPPGYPLYMWLLHAFLAVVPWGSPFVRAAFLDSLYMLGGMALLVALADRWLTASLVLVLGTLPLVWRAAVLPDVFGLHVLVSAAVLFFAVARDVRYRELLVCLAFGLAAANQQTVIFLAPVVIVVLACGRSWRRAIIAASSGAAVCVALYLSLMLFDSDAPQSWAKIHDAGAVLRHFLRSDYGMFALYPGHTPSTPRATLLALVGATVPILAAMAVALVVTIRSRERSREQRIRWAVVVCFGLYAAVFVARMNFPNIPMFFAMRERFFVFPAVLAAAVAMPMSLPALGRPLRLAIGGVISIVIALNVVHGMPCFELPRDTVIEDYAHNILDTAAAGGRPSFLILDGDSELSGVLYVQATGDTRDVIAFSVGRALNKRMLAKLQSLRPALRVDAVSGKGGNHGPIIRELIEPNVDAFDFTHTLRTLTPRLRTIYYPVGRKLVRGTGIAFADAPSPPRYNLPVYNVEAEYVENKEIYNEYADYYVARGNDAEQQGDSDAAARYFRQGYDIVPWCGRCLENACRLEHGAGEDCAH